MEPSPFLSGPSGRARAGNAGAVLHPRELERCLAPIVRRALAGPADGTPLGHQIRAAAREVRGDAADRDLVAEVCRRLCEFVAGGPRPQCDTLRGP